MREILFRGRRKDNGEWVEGYYVCVGEHHYILTGKLDLTMGYPAYIQHNVIPETVGQYTGLTDKNGVKIFEGDICKNTENGKTAVVKWYEEYNADMLYCKSENCIYWLFDVDFEKIEVIGNIHDNPELMGGNENENGENAPC